MDKHFIPSIQVAAVYIGTVVGAGFATGKEIVEFFTRYGFYGILGILLAGWLFCYCGVKIMIISKRIGAKSYQDFNLYLFGKPLGSVINFLMIFILLGVTSVMLSGAGAVFEEQLHLPKQLGIGITMALGLFVMINGVKGVYGVNIFVVPMLVLFSMIVAVQAFSPQSIFLTGEGPTYHWIVSAFSYGAFNLAMAQAVLVPLASEIDEEASLKTGGIIGGIVLTIILLGSHFALSSLPTVMLDEIPMASVIKNSYITIYFVYVCVIYGEIFTSVIGNLYGLERQLSQLLKLKSSFIIGTILLISYFISQLGYGHLISILYPFYGYLSLGFLVLLLVKKYPLP
ncbi:YkvI family membrane protein [Metabacillus arenae]|uniref:Transporter n=1 Tax=Metabacillus arenae TaxID=2771434 RepID=A0A926RWX4_9BACI|nr:hypothetical protein [Metabacillus arenae]MBD1380386.1 hypothetical protein [Metabacillus arenae]